MPRSAVARLSDGQRLFHLERSILDVQLNGPVQIISPAVGSRLNSERKVMGREPARFGGRPNQFHASLFGCATSLPVITSEAGGHDVIPLLLSASSDWDDVIESQIFSRGLLAAILAFVVVSRIDVRAGEFDLMPILDPNIVD